MTAGLQHTPGWEPRNRRMLAVLGLVVAGMVALAYASVPLYDLFCRVTGFGGTTTSRRAAPRPAVAGPPVNVRFDANVNPALNWHLSRGDRRAGQPASRGRGGDSLPGNQYRRCAQRWDRDF